MNGKQKTLFQTWGASLPPDSKKQKEIKPKKNKSNAAVRGKSASGPQGPHYKGPSSAWNPPTVSSTTVVDEEDDDVLLVAVYEAEKSINQTVTPGANNKDIRSDEFGTTGSYNQVQGQSIYHAQRLNGDGYQYIDTHDPEHGAVPTSANGHHLSSTAIQSLQGFDLSAGNVWIYPTNFPVRDYQFNIAHTALLQNTLVCLPTGLGKTFIAAVVMYNFYRWYPSCKIVFMAPTKPLVAQQIEACFKVMGIPQEHMAEMTGTTQLQNRKEMWGKRRVFFLTPQVMVNDLARGACPASDIKCMVIDEAHKALGNHAYCQVVRELSNYNKQFRILALSATPGSDAKSVQQVVSNLLIAQIELRSEDSPDIQPYSHTRQLEKFVVPLGTELEAVQKAYLQILETFAGRLIRNNVLSRRDIPNLTKYQMVLFRDQFRKNPPANIVGVQLGVVEGDFALCISLYHGYELLLQMGTRSLYYFLRAIMDGSKGMTRAKNELSRNGDFMELYQHLENMFAGTNDTRADGSLLFNTSLRSDVKKPFIYSHPKLKKLEEVVVEHFKSWEKNSCQSTSVQTPLDTRIMIFSSFRESVQEIAEMLNQHQPTVRVMTFVGHSSTGKGVKGFTQKEQLEVVKRFREGGYNTLVSTCVGEEGLDIGEVDLIICFDAQKSPIRLVQRMGRTGRKRQGRIVVILCKGREERTYNQSQSNKRSIYKAIQGNNNMFHLNPQSPRMIPDGINPQVHKMFITQGTFESRDVPSFSKDRKSSTVHRKSSLFYNMEDAMKEDWPMTHGEFETWNRLYRLQEADGITDVTLPKSYFEYFQDTEGSKEAPSENARELSLTEWSVWQNRPFHTDSVDHSDRCKHFISIMEMIELMRHEKDGCKYDSELMAYFCKEDVGLSSKTTKDKVVNPISYPTVDKKFPHIKKGKTNKILPKCSFMDTDEECKSLFKAPNGKKNIKLCTSELVNTETAFRVFEIHDQDEGVTDDNVCSENGVESSKPHSLFVNKITPSDQDHRLPNNSEDSVPKRQSFADSKADSGYQSFSEDSSSLLTNIFYIPQIQTDYVLAEILEDKMCKLKNMLSCVKVFLSKSPPPLSELNFVDNLEVCTNTSFSIDYKVPLTDMSEQTLTPTKDLISVTKGQVENSVKRTQVHSDKTANTGLLILDASVSNARCITAVLSTHNNLILRESCSQDGNTKESKVDETEYDPHWDKIFDGDSDESEIEEFDAFNLNSPDQGEDCFENEMTEKDENHCLGNEQTEKDENHCLVNEHTEKDKKHCLGNKHKDKNENHCLGNEHNEKDEDLDESFDLFEDEPFADFDNYSQGSLASSNKKDIPGDKATGVTFNMFDPSSFLQDQDDTEQESENMGVLDSDKVWHQIDEERVDCSEELFSVNFDLGFSVQDDNELSESEVSLSSESEAEHGKQTTSKHSIVPSPPKSNNLSVAGGNMSTPLTSINQNSTFVKVSEKQMSLFSPLQPVDRKFSLTPEKSLCLSFMTPLSENQKNSNISFHSASKYELDTPITPKSSKKNRSPPATHNSHNSINGGLETGQSKKDLPTPEISNYASIAGSSNDSEDEIVFRRKRKSTKSNVLISPKAASSDCDFDSPIPAAKKRKHALNTTDSCDDEDADFKSTHSFQRSEAAALSKKTLKDVRRSTHKKRMKHAARQYFDDEAELSSDGAEFVSSDEALESENEQDSSIIGFLNDNTQLSQGLNDSEMVGVYLKSVRSPVVSNPFKMVQRKKPSMAIFSQIPEQDESYMEDSFCVDEEIDEEDIELQSSEEEVTANIDLLQQDSFVEGRKQYCTRRRLQMKKLTFSDSDIKRPEKKKPSRIIIHDDSSEEEPEVVSDTRTNVSSAAAKPSFLAQATDPPSPLKSGFDVPLRDRCQARLNLKASVSEALDFQAENTSHSITKQKTSDGIILPADKESDKRKNVSSDSSWLGSSTLSDHSFMKVHPPGSSANDKALCILTDSREISSGPEVISCLKNVHGVKVQVCSLGGCDYIVSNRMAVERKIQSEFSNSANRSRLIERIQHLQNLFERVCLVVEKDRVKPGETSKIFQRTKYYDSTLSALISAGIRILFSSSQEESAGLLKELALLEQRKKSGIIIPTEVKGYKQEALQFYLTIPNINYLTALNLCHRFESVKQMVNSSVDVIANLAQVNPQKAEEIFRYLHYVFESQMLPSNNNVKRKQNL
ncbi:Fanconi anemia group M protein [Bombina bombina]|uniref:Fanconi anemia group M protein n=1 Tax=Bombina bombina TaxID=8345 RepID=UPI00235B0641|nr:Fanconi anemia group M protein [Bombina bombina]